MADTALYVSIGANMLLALPHLAKGFSTHASTLRDLAERMKAVEVDNKALREKVHDLEMRNMELTRARLEAEAYARQLEDANVKLTEAKNKAEESERHARHLFAEVQRLYDDINSSHQGISVRPPRPEES
jgi:superfamily II RNA helicase